jgi:hypothetical protein
MSADTSGFRCASAIEETSLQKGQPLTVAPRHVGAQDVHAGGEGEAHAGGLSHGFGMGHLTKVKRARPPAYPRAGSFSRARDC